MKGRGPEPWPGGTRGRFSIIVGLLIALLIVAVLAWVVLTWPRPGWRSTTPVVPTVPAP